MSEPVRKIVPSHKAPQITALSIAFPLNFESPTPPAPQDPNRANTPNNTPRPTHRHDAGE